MATSITTCLAFNDRCEEAVKFYTSLFKNSKVTSLVRSEGDGPIPKGKVTAATFTLNGKEFTAFDGGDPFTFAMGMSLMVNCDTQQEIDHLYDGLAKGGQAQPCGWVQDKFGLSWQIIPAKLGKWLNDSEGGNTQKATEAMLQMKKLDLAKLERAYRGK